MQPRRVNHYFTVYWGNPYTDPPDGFERVVCVARVTVDRGRGAGSCPHDVEVALRYWNLVVSGREYGGGYVVAWHVEPADDAPRRRLSDEAKFRIRRRRLEERMRRRYPLFADDFIADELQRRPDYFGVQEVRVDDRAGR